MMLDSEFKFLCKKTKNSRVVLYLLSSSHWLLTSNFGAPTTWHFASAWSGSILVPRGSEEQNYNPLGSPWELALQVTMETEDTMNVPGGLSWRLF